ncbi:MAG: hypothetical protein KJ906_03570 [Nanoarchaeota archaeon]|nr:hypothetical protein [Nanoarchaeota archaeon]
MTITDEYENAVESINKEISVDSIVQEARRVAIHRFVNDNIYVPRHSKFNVLKEQGLATVEMEKLIYEASDLSAHGEYKEMFVKLATFDNLIRDLK